MRNSRKSLLTDGDKTDEEVIKMELQKEVTAQNTSL